MYTSRVPQTKSRPFRRHLGVILKKLDSVLTVDDQDASLFLRPVVHHTRGLGQMVERVGRFTQHPCQDGVHFTLRDGRLVFGHLHRGVPLFTFTVVGNMFIDKIDVHLFTLVIRVRIDINNHEPLILKGDDNFFEDLDEFFVGVHGSSIP